MTALAGRDRHVVVVGAGPGGLTAAMLLAHRGFRVTVFEKQARVGGRNGELRVGDYVHDIGPTFLMMKFLLDEVFRETGRDSADYLDFVKLDPMYELVHDEFSLFPTSDRDRMRAEIGRVFGGEERGFDRFMRGEQKRYARLYPCLQKPYSSLTAFLSFAFIWAIPRLSLTRSLYGVLAGYYGPERLRLSFTFQSKYLGMSPWTCPGAFAMIPYVEYAFGIFHVQGGLSCISRAMAKVIDEEGGEVLLSTPVRRIVVEGRVAKGVELEDGTRVEADAVVLNADFAHAMTHIVDPGDIRKYTERNLRTRNYSCSTFMMYLGLDTVYDMQHHTICFSSDYKRNLDEIANRKVLSEDPSFYVRNASVTDPGIAPKGHSAVYVLVPVPNNSSGIDWDREADTFRERVLCSIERRTPMKDIRKHVRAEKIIHPADWESGHDVFLGATFNLAHNLGQMLYFRPRNRFEEWRNCYLVGGGTHPGSGLPTIYESGRISADLISRRYGASLQIR